MYRRPVRVANDADLWRKLSAVMLCLAVVATPIGAVTTSAAAVPTQTNDSTTQPTVENSSPDLRQAEIDELEVNGGEDLAVLG